MSAPLFILAARTARASRCMPYGAAAICGPAIRSAGIAFLPRI
jgi:hypothetical protein